MALREGSHIHKLTLKLYTLFFLGQALSGASLRHTLPDSANKLSLDTEAPSGHNRNSLGLL